MDAPKSILETEKILNNLSSVQIYKKNKKNKKKKKKKKNPKKPTGLVFFFFKPGFFPTLPG
jgi:hypothetical protein